VGQGAWVDVAVTNRIVATVSGLTPATTYEFRVFAEDAAGRSDPSAVVTATTPAGP
jgi:chitodextrinase